MKKHEIVTLALRVGTAGFFFVVLFSNTISHNPKVQASVEWAVERLSEPIAHLEHIWMEMIYHSSSYEKPKSNVLKHKHEWDKK